ncbi:FAD-dependent oxidoreductase [Paralimibaculum aggregatum]|uniref:FAD-dependent oxidoreductase n=1 Tax=Paralimibaculum aggregatum TaxID=3036245 RepID=A0ABQ6LQI6_9RHOB|nr:FAD-binding oxidoreductase [Limibaculum sp. NKW23]GMG84860.1 FAD-dependent oxidoreductase [Limibaculum sp. NKW23]
MTTATAARTAPRAAATGPGPAWAAEMTETPFWHAAAPPEPPSGRAPPAEADVAIVGAGFTGLSAALHLAEAGRRVVVLEAGPPGAGASTRNGGMIGWGHKARLAPLAKRYGEGPARAMLREAQTSLNWTRALLGRLPVDALHRQTGRFLGAGSALHFERLAAWARDEAPALGMEVEVVPAAEQAAHIGSELYRGGLYFPNHGLLHPALFHKGLLEAARNAGAEVIDHAAVTAIAGAPGAWRLATAKGPLTARELVWAGNGYAARGGRAFARFARRLIPVPSFIIATEPVGENRMRSLFPGGHAHVDTRAAHSYYRPCPWGERILWGGRASLLPLPPRVAAARLRDQMLSVYPELGDLRLTHSWTGNVAFSFDGVPHIGQIDGVWHACGYNGSGVAMAPYLGMRLAERLLGPDQGGAVRGSTGFDAARFRAQPLYGGNPWFLRGLEIYYRTRERLEGVARIPRN